MSELFDKSIRTLELPRVLQMLSEQAVSAAQSSVPETLWSDIISTSRKPQFACAAHTVSHLPFLRTACTAMPAVFLNAAMVRWFL